MSQYQTEQVEQDDILAAFVMWAVFHAAPTHETFVDMVRNACVDGELERLDHALSIEDTEVRGAAFLMLLGDILARIAQDELKRRSVARIISGNICGRMRNV